MSATSGHTRLMSRSCFVPKRREIRLRTKAHPPYSETPGARSRRGSEHQATNANDWYEVGCLLSRDPADALSETAVYESDAWPVKADSTYLDSRRNPARFPAGSVEQELHGEARGERDPEIVVERNGKELEDRRGEGADQAHMEGNPGHEDRQRVTDEEAREASLERLPSEKADLPDRLPHDRRDRVPEDQKPERQDRDRLVEEVKREEHRDQEVGRSQERDPFVIPEKLAEEVPEQVPEPGIVQPEDLD